MSLSLVLAKAWLGKRVTVVVERPLGSRHPMHGFEYAANYGHVPGTEAPDGEALDAYVLGVADPVAEFVGTCVAVIHRADDDDDKLVVVPDWVQLGDEEIARAVAFQEQWFRTSIVRE